MKSLRGSLLLHRMTYFAFQLQKLVVGFGSIKLVFMGSRKVRQTLLQGSYIADQLLHAMMVDSLDMAEIGA